jgi:spore coat polysaccharide biosynthesis predicted glycosyltransferase SpsG
MRASTSSIRIDERVLFRAAAGPGRGFGHLVRCRALARALGVVPRVWLRGPRSALAAACRLGVELVGRESLGPRIPGGGARPGAVWPRMLVVDDPSVYYATECVERGRRHGWTVATVHDLGLAYVPSDVGIDGSLQPGHQMRGRIGDLRGPSYAILDPTVLSWQSRRLSVAEPARILVALGGGRHVRELAAVLVQALARRLDSAWGCERKNVTVRVASGFTTQPRPYLESARWVTANDGLGEELARATVAIVGGGLTLYEACAIGTPSVAIAVVPAQMATIRAMAARGACVSGGQADGTVRFAERVATLTRQLLANDRVRHRLGDQGRDLIDGRGAFRVADRLRDLVDLPRRVDAA